jgi:hypothetical protein
VCRATYLGAHHMIKRILMTLFWANEIRGAVTVGLLVLAVLR